MAGWAIVLVCLLHLSLVLSFAFASEERYPEREPEYEEEEPRKSPAFKLARMLGHSGLPEGILPSSILKYNIAEDGTVALDLENACYAHIEQEVVWFDKHVEFKINPFRLDAISGISAKQLIFWLPVTSIHVGEGDEADQIYFDVGIMSKKFHASAFEEPVQCTKEDVSFIQYFWSSVMWLPWH